MAARSRGGTEVDLRFLAVPLLLLAATAGAAQAQSYPTGVDSASAPADPLERTNRALFNVHQSLDRNVVRPVAQGYKAVTTAPVRKGVRNVLNNLGEPITFINDVLQGQAVRAGQTATRFVANSTVGVLGVFDVATAAGVPGHEEDFGQTLAVYGVKPGPYIFVPVLGPTNARDLTGRVVDVVINPINALDFEGATAFRGSAGVVNGVDARASADAELQRLEVTATDAYATYRSLYAQNRAARIANGESDVESLPEFVDYAPEPAPAATPRSVRR
jgi:phospholipid-binding lipoprotein MlaA